MNKHKRVLLSVGERTEELLAAITAVRLSLQLNTTIIWDASVKTEEQKALAEASGVFTSVLLPNHAISNGFDLIVSSTPSEEDAKKYAEEDRERKMAEMRFVIEDEEEISKLPTLVLNESMAVCAYVLDQLKVIDPTSSIFNLLDSIINVVPEAPTTKRAEKEMRGVIKSQDLHDEYFVLVPERIKKEYEDLDTIIRPSLPVEVLYVSDDVDKKLDPPQINALVKHDNCLGVISDGWEIFAANAYKKPFLVQIIKDESTQQWSGLYNKDALHVVPTSEMRNFLRENIKDIVRYRFQDYIDFS